MDSLKMEECSSNGEALKAHESGSLSSQSFISSGQILLVPSCPHTFDCQSLYTTVRRRNKEYTYFLKPVIPYRDVGVDKIPPGLCSEPVFQQPPSESNRLNISRSRRHEFLGRPLLLFPRSFHLRACLVTLVSVTGHCLY